MIQALQTLSLDDARKQAFRLLRDSEQYECVPCQVQCTFQAHATVLDLFRDDEEFRSIRGELYLSRQLVAPVQRLPDWDMVGTDIEHIEVIVNRTTGEVQQFDGDVEAMRREQPYPSIFHLIVQVQKFIDG